MTGALRFLLTPAELWIRLVGAVMRAKVVVDVGAVDVTRLAVALSRDKRRLRISVNDNHIVLSKTEAVDLVERVRSVTDEMEPVS